MDIRFQKTYTDESKPDVLMEAGRIKRVYGDPHGLINSVKKNLGDQCVPPTIVIEDKGAPTRKILINVTVSSNLGAMYCAEQLKKDAIASGWELVGPSKRAVIGNTVQVRSYKPTNSLFAMSGHPLPTIYEEEERRHNPIVNLTQQPSANPVVKSSNPSRRPARYTPEMAAAAATIARSSPGVTPNMVKGFVRQTGILPRTYENLGLHRGGALRKSRKNRSARKNQKTAKNRRHK